MKKLYWRPQKISLRLLWVVAFVAVFGLVSVESYTVQQKQSNYSQKIEASKLAKKAFAVVKEESLRLGHEIDPEADPAATGIIGVLLSPVTTNPGHLPAKQTSANPNFAAVLVHLLIKAGVEENSKVAVGISGSFPAINICVLAALATLKAQPIIISSAGSSQWGANNQDFMWPDIEKLLYERRIFPFRSLAISRGGIDDRALGLAKNAKKQLDDVINRSGVPALMVSNYAESVEQRMDIYRQHSGDDEIVAYINVGGGTTSVGTRLGKKMFRPGLNRSVPRGVTSIDSVMTRFALSGVPIIHMTNISRIAERYGLPLEPAIMPRVGEGKIFYKEAHSQILAGFVLLLIISLLIAFIRLDWGYRFLASNKKDKVSNNPERMV